MARNHTIRDVAREAGVSVATVSRVLNNKPDASAVAREKVEDAIGKLGVRAEHPMATAHHREDPCDLLALSAHGHEPEPHLLGLHRRRHVGVRRA